MPQERLKNLKDEVRSTLKKPNLEGRLQKMRSLVVDLMKKWI